jgi:membrane-associated phospholipid phosphatase
MPWKAWLLAASVAAVILILTRIAGRTGSLLRDFAPLAFTLTAYREMDWFTPAVRDRHLERAWIVWDRRLLDHWHLRAAIESLGALLPSRLELCYLLVYGVAPVSLALLFMNGQRAHVSRFWLAYLAGTLGAYALFPYFPSEPPRIAFSGADLPRVVTVLRQINLWILGGYSIHSSVFPSAHVSSAFSAAWALLATVPQRPWIGRGMALYAVSVAIAAIYGRYHFAADALAGFAVSLLALPCLMLTRPKLSPKTSESGR